MFDFSSIYEGADEIQKHLASQVRKRRLEKGMSRAFLSKDTGVPAPTICHFETTGEISLKSFIKLVSALGYRKEVKSILDDMKYETMEELEAIKKNVKRSRGKRTKK